MNIIIGADHGGFELKEKICEWLQKEGHVVTDIGASNFDPLDDYPDFAAKVSEVLLTTPDSKGIIICGNINYKYTSHPAATKSACRNAPCRRTPRKIFGGNFWVILDLELWEISV